MKKGILCLLFLSATTTAALADGSGISSDSQETICASLRTSIKEVHAENLSAQLKAEQVNTDLLAQLMTPYESLNCKDVLVTYDKKASKLRNFCENYPHKLDEAIMKKRNSRNHEERDKRETELVSLKTEFDQKCRAKQSYLNADGSLKR